MKKKVIIGIVSILVVITGCLFVMFNSSNRGYEVITNDKVITLGRRRDMFLMKDFLVAKMVVSLLGMMKEKQLLYLQMYLTNAIFILINIMLLLSIALLLVIVVVKV